MNLRKNWLGSGLKSAERREEPKKPAKVRNAKATPGRHGKVGMTLYVSEEAHALLKEVMEEEDKQLKEFLTECVNLGLVRYGKKPIA